MILMASLLLGLFTAMPAKAGGEYFSTVLEDAAVAAQSPLVNVAMNKPIIEVGGCLCNTEDDASRDFKPSEYPDRWHPGYLTDGMGGDPALDIHVQHELNGNACLLSPGGYAIVDLGKEYDITLIQVTTRIQGYVGSQGGSYENYNVKVSADGDVWEDLRTVKAGPPPENYWFKTINFNQKAQQTRYIKLTAVDGGFVLEIRAYAALGYTTELSLFESATASQTESGNTADIISFAGANVYNANWIGKGTNGTSVDLTLDAGSVKDIETLYLTGIDAEIYYAGTTPDSVTGTFQSKQDFEVYASDVLVGGVVEKTPQNLVYTQGSIPYGGKYATLAVEIGRQARYITISKLERTDVLDNYLAFAAVSAYVRNNGLTNIALQKSVIASSTDSSFGDASCIVDGVINDDNFWATGMNGWGSEIVLDLGRLYDVKRVDLSIRCVAGYGEPVLLDILGSEMDDFANPILLGQTMGAPAPTRQAFNLSGEYMARFIKVKPTDTSFEGAQSHYWNWGISELEVYAVGEPMRLRNVALNKNATATREETGNAASVVDGTDSYWGPGLNGYADYVTVDLGAWYNVKKLTLELRNIAFNTIEVPYVDVWGSVSENFENASVKLGEVLEAGEAGTVHEIDVTVENMVRYIRVQGKGDPYSGFATEEHWNWAVTELAVYAEDGKRNQMLSGPAITASWATGANAAEVCDGDFLSTSLGTFWFLDLTFNKVYDITGVALAANYNLDTSNQYGGRNRLNYSFRATEVKFGKNELRDFPFRQPAFHLLQAPVSAESVSWERRHPEYGVEQFNNSATGSKVNGGSEQAISANEVAVFVADNYNTEGVFLNNFVAEFDNEDFLNISGSVENWSDTPVHMGVMIVSYKESGSSLVIHDFKMEQGTIAVMGNWAYDLKLDTLFWPEMEIYGDFDIEDCVTVKVFVWDMDTLKPYGFKDISLN